jgi:hypothetical protein
VPIVLYNGESAWTPVQSFKEYTANYGEFGDNIIDFKYLLFDLNRHDESDILTTHKLLDYVFNMDLNHTTRTVEDFDREYQRLIKIKHELTDDDIRTFALWLKYALLRGDVPDNFEREVVAAFQKGEGDNMSYAFNRLVERERVSAAEQAAEKAEKRALEKKLKAARGMKADNVPIAIIQKHLELTDEQALAL